MLNSCDLFNTILKKWKQKENSDVACCFVECSTLENKFKYLKTILNNFFIRKDIKEGIFSLFQKSQTTYRALCKFAFLIKYKKAPIQNTTDLYLTPINPKDKRCYLHYQEKTRSKYWFTTSELIEIIKKQSMNTSDFFLDPLPCKNPYNNITIELHELYNMYFHIRDTAYILPPFIQSLFLCNMNINLYSVLNEETIRSDAIYSYVMNSSNTVLLLEIDHLLELTNMPFNINRNVPKNELINAFLPFLYLFCIHKYGVTGTEKKRGSLRLLKQKLKELYKYNPDFGKKKVNGNMNWVGSQPSETAGVSYNLDKPSFTMNDIKRLLFEEDTTIPPMVESSFSTMSTFIEPVSLLSSFSNTSYPYDAITLISILRGIAVPRDSSNVTMNQANNTPLIEQYSTGSSSNNVANNIYHDSSDEYDEDDEEEEEEEEYIPTDSETDLMEID